ncbi:MAG: 4-alpha-glucanotransferase, partial [Stomatobaculum longum]|nr:4-alpha-glucanotransferase [Stomatobaculum longum]
EGTRLFMLRYQGSEHTPEQDLYWDCIRTVLASVADTVIIPMWDYLGCGKEARINVPSAAGGNWQWRMPRHSFTEHLIWHCRMLAEIYGREPKPVPVPPELEAALAEAEAATKSEETAGLH